MARRKVKITIDGSKGSRVTAAGGTVADGVTPGELPGGQGADVELDLTNLDGDEITAAGDHVLRYQQVSEPLDELAQILAAALTKGQADDLREIIADIKTQADRKSVV